MLSCVGPSFFGYIVYCLSRGTNVITRCNLFLGFHGYENEPIKKRLPWLPWMICVIIYLDYVEVTHVQDFLVTRGNQCLDYLGYHNQPDSRSPWLPWVVHLICYLEYVTWSSRVHYSIKLIDQVESTCICKHIISVLIMNLHVRVVNTASLSSVTL